MNHYTMPLPRAYLGLAAAAMTVITFGLTVFLPAMLDSGGAAGNGYSVGTVAVGEQRCAGGIGPQMLTQDSSTPTSTRVQ
jgi:hypothetical protein